MERPAAPYAAALARAPDPEVFGFLPFSSRGQSRAPAAWGLAYGVFGVLYTAFLLALGLGRGGPAETGGRRCTNGAPMTPRVT